MEGRAVTDGGDALAPGTRLGELEIERVLGAGGFGVTYLARDLGLDAWRAVKEYLPLDWGGRGPDGTVGPRTERNAKDYQWGLEKFLEEARTLERFRHPHIVQVYRVFEAGGTAYMVMEYVEGRSLASKVKAGGPLPEAEVRKVLLALTDGLSNVHAADDLLHRDISPDNVILRPDGTPVLIDFGAARHGLGEHSGSLTSVLKPGYAPLEQYPPGRGQGPWTDIYALGALAYYALSGEVPTVATERTREDPLPRLSEVAPRGVSRSLASAVDAALAVYAEDRPQSLAQWTALLAGRPAVAVPAGSGRGGAAGSRAAPRGGDVDASSVRSRRPESRRRWLAGAAAAAGLGVAALAVALLGPWNARLADEEPVPEETASAGETTPATTEAGGPGSGETSSSARSEGTTLADGAPEPLGAGEETAAADRCEAAAPPPSPAEVEAAVGLGRLARRTIQEGLAASGFDAGAADGLFGPGTRRALREWQAASGVTATGYVDASAAAALRVAAEEAARVADERQAEREAEARRQAELEAEAERRRPGRVFRDCDACPEMVVMAGGDLALGRYEVTVGEYRAFASATGSGAGNCYGDSWRDPGFPQTNRHPVVCVSWLDAQEYLSWLSRETGETYRLPTSAESERGAADAQPGCHEDRTGRPGTCPVGAFGFNEAGLSDMGGNVWEWTADCWDSDCRYRDLRGGGSWSSVARFLGPSARNFGGTDARNDAYGFRVSRTLD